MSSTVEQVSPTRAKLTVQIPFTELKPAIDRAYQQIASQITIPGFRKGKVPPAVIDQRFGRASVLQEVVNEAIPDAYGRAIVEHNLSPLTQPEVELTRLEDNDLVEFVAEVDVRPDFDVPDFASVSVSVDPVAENSEVVEERIQILRNRFATNTEVDRPAREGDKVTVDLDGKQNGETLEDAHAEGVTYVVGDDNFVEGLDEAVTGMKAGDVKTFSTTLLGGSKKGEAADITVTVTKVEEQEFPEVNDDFAQLVSQFDTVEEMKADLAGGAQREAQMAQAAQARDKALEALLAQTPFELPEKLVADEVEARKEQINQQLARAGMTVETYLENAEDEDATTADEFWDSIAERAEQALRAQILLDKIADDREIGVEQQDLISMIFSKAQENGTSPEQELSHMQEHGHQAQWMGEIRRSKALAMIVDAATITDTDGNVVDLSALKPSPAEVVPSDAPESEDDLESDQEESDDDLEPAPNDGSVAAAGDSESRNA